MESLIESELACSTECTAPSLIHQAVTQVTDVEARCKAHFYHRVRAQAQIQSSAAKILSLICSTLPMPLILTYLGALPSPLPAHAE